MNGDDEKPSGVPSAIDPLGINAAATEVWRAMLGAPQTVLETQAQFANAWMTLATRTMARGTSPSPEPMPRVVDAAPGDGRWKHPAWQENPLFDALKQGYLLATQAVLDGIDRAPDVDDETRARVKFFAKQFCDAMSPTNFAMLNPAVIEETVKTGGTNLQRGVENALADLRDNDGRPALVDKAAFTVGVNVAASAGHVVFRNDLIEVIQYTPSTPKVRERPLVIIPPWINKFYILDLQPKNSLIKYATDNGMQTFVVSWRNPDAELGHLGFADYLELGPLAAGEVARSITGCSSVNQIGYCIGGTLTSMQLAYLAKTDPSLVNAVTTFAAQVDFTEAGELRHFLPPPGDGGTVKKPEEHGVFPASNMADTFNLLRANDLIWNTAVNRYLLGKDAPAFDLLYWNSDATRMPGALHDDYLRNMYGKNALAEGKISIKGVDLDLHAIRNDVYSLASIEDHIAPWRSVYKMTQIFGGHTRFRLGHSGHIAGIINAPTSGRGKYWTNDVNPPSADEWFAGAVEHAGSWWPDWMTWLTERAGDEVDAPTAPGNEKYPALVPAPGTYVLEKG
ncbi:MAG: class I poly(R)-hydroxyalkanoic acid synthase [Vulcanimicrobiaceae bacterium]